MSHPSPAASPRPADPLATYQASERARAQAHARADLMRDAQTHAQRAQDAHPCPAHARALMHAQRAHARAQRQAETTDRLRLSAHAAYMRHARPAPDVAPRGTSERAPQPPSPSRARPREEEHAPSRAPTPGGPLPPRAAGPPAPLRKCVAGGGSSPYDVLRGGVLEGGVLRFGVGEEPRGVAYYAPSGPRGGAGGRRAADRPGDGAGRACVPAVDWPAGLVGGAR